MHLASVRHQIAGLVGSTSYMHYRMQGAALTDDPAEVQKFLMGQAAMHRSAAADSLEQLQRCARATGLIRSRDALSIWDVSLARQQGLEQEMQRLGLPAQAPSFPVEVALQTLFRVADHLFGVTFEQVECSSRYASASEQITPGLGACMQSPVPCHPGTPLPAARFHRSEAVQGVLGARCAEVSGGLPGARHPRDGVPRSVPARRQATDQRPLHAALWQTHLP